MDTKNLTSRDRNALAKQYYPLVCKIAIQLHTASGYDLDECKSAGNIGLIKAMETYDENKGEKKQTFTQYAAYIIRGYILNDINANSHTIRVNQDQQKKLKAEGKSLDVSVSLDKVMGSSEEEGTCTLAHIIPGDTSSEVYASIDPAEDDMWKMIYDRLHTVFSERDMDIFYSTFGINGYEEKNGKEMALKYMISPGAVTQVRNKILSYMKKDQALRAMLVDILQLQAGDNYAL